MARATWRRSVASTSSRSQPAQRPVESCRSALVRSASGTLLWLGLERDDLAEAKALTDQLRAHSQQLPPTNLHPLLERVVHDSTDESQTRQLLRQAAGMAKTIGYL